MFELLLIIAFLWLFVKAIGLTFRQAWGTAKVIAAILVIVALPALVLCMLFAGGILLVLPLAILAVAVGIAKAVL